MNLIKVFLYNTTWYKKQINLETSNYIEKKKQIPKDLVYKTNKIQNQLHDQLFQIILKEIKVKQDKIIQ